MKNIYSAEEFEQVLKNFFVEKAKVLELQKQLQAKLFVSEEYAKLKAAYEAKEKECEHFKNQFGKTRPALKKLIDDLKCAQEQLARLKEIEVNGLKLAHLERQNLGLLNEREALQKQQINLQKELEVALQEIELLKTIE